MADDFITKIGGHTDRQTDTQRRVLSCSATKKGPLTLTLGNMEHKSYFKVKCLFKLNTFDLSLVITLLKCPQFGPKMADGV